jgi:hypothetical protein
MFVGKPLSVGREFSLINTLGCSRGQGVLISGLKVATWVLNVGADRLSCLNRLSLIEPNTVGPVTGPEYPYKWIKSGYVGTKCGG